MATRPGEVRINIVGNADRLKTATDQASKELNKFGEDASKKLGKIGDSFSNVGKKMTTHVTLPIVAGIGLIGKAAMDEEASVNQFNKAMENAGVAPEVIKSYDQWITKQQEKLGFDDAEIRQVVALNKQRGLSDAETKKRTTDAMNIARQKGISLTAAEKLYTQALAGSAKALRQFGIEQKNADGSNKTSAQIQEELAAKTAGAAESYSKTSKGQFEALRQTFQNTLEDLGTQLLPVISDLMKKLAKLAKEWGPKIANFIKDHGALIAKILLVAAALGPMILGIGKLVKVVQTAIKIVQAVNAALTFLAANPIVLVIIAIVAAIALLVFVFKKLYDNNEKFREMVDKVWQFIQKAWDAILNVIKVVIDAIVWYVTTYIKVIRVVIETVINVVLAIWSAVWNTIKTVVTAVWDGIVWYVTTYINVIKTVIETVVNVIVAIWNFAWGAVKAGFETVWNGLLTIVTTVWDGIQSAVKTGVNAVIGFINIMIRAWNSLDFEIPKVHVPGTNLDFGGFNVGLPDIPEIPKLHSGGVVPGRRGAEVPAILQAGEVVLTAAQAAGLNKPVNTFNITVNQSNASASDIAREIAWQMKTMGR